MTINYLALAVAAVASFVFGAVWYGALSRQWMDARGISSANPQKPGSTTGSAMPYLIAFIAELVMAWMLAGVLLHLARGGLAPNMRNGLISAAFLWFGFVATTLVVNHAFQDAKRTLTLIDGGHWLGVLLVQGAILGGWGIH